MAEVGDVLRRAARTIRDGHWCQGVYTDGRGNYCAVGAIALHTCGFRFTDYGTVPDWRAAALVEDWRAAVNAAARTVAFAGYVTVGNWNDGVADPEVIAAGLEKAAAWWDETHG